MARESFKYRRSGSFLSVRVLVIWGSLAAGVVAMMMTNHLINQAKQAVVVEAPEPMETVNVLVVTADVGVGQKLDPAVLKWQMWPKEALAGTFITDTAAPRAPEEFGGRIVRRPISAGEPLIAQKLHEQKNGGFLSAALPSGMRAVSIKISPETGAGGFILPDDRVDVLLTRQKPGAGGESTVHSSETVLRNVRVLAIDQSLKDKTERDDENSVAVGKTATVEVTPQQAEVLALAEAQGDLSLTLRSLADNDESPDPVGVMAMRVHAPMPSGGGVAVTRFPVAPASGSVPANSQVALY